MNLFKRSRGLLAGGLMALAFAAMQPAVALAKPEPGARPRGFRLFARTLGAVVVNRVYLGLNASKGHIGVDSLGSSTIGGGYWPKGTANQYVFNSGLQIAGKIDKPGFDWDGDVTGAFFFDPKGTTEHGEEVEPVYNSQDPADVADWPAFARVPDELDEDDDLFNPLLRNRINASQGDVWFLTWDGNPSLIAGRPHPLGVLVESRGLAWNFPAGNEDIVYFTFTFYNVTASDPTVYANVRPDLRDKLAALGQEFQAENEATFGVSIPDEGYAIDSLFAAFGADMDVSSDAGANYCSVNLPFAMGFCYEHTFTAKAEETYDAQIFGPPFFAGTGFVGVKYLRSPTGAGEIQLFSNTINSATGFRDPQNVFQLFRYLSGTVSAAAGDQPCNQGNPLVTRVCFINPTFADSRFYQSSTALTLAPGEFGSIVVAYMFAAPVAVPGFAPTASTDVRPGDVLRLTNPGQLAQGANLTDSLAGFIGFENSDDPEDVTVTQSEFRVVPGSLLSKGLIAQAVYDAGFLLPFAPDAPEFYLIPGNNEVTVLWSQSRSEIEGDPYFAVASSPTQTVDGNTTPNLLYDPNYRQFDVEGYRIYRGRVDNAEALTLVAQFDYAGTVIRDYTGQVNPVNTCAPELNVTDDCPVDFDFEAGSGLPATEFVEYPLVGDVIQVKLGPSRAVLADGTVLVLSADTAVTGRASGVFPALQDNGVPFAYQDREVKNNFRYFYSVTAFDVNSFQSGPTSLESARVTKSVTPVPSASNTEFAQLEVTVVDGNGNPFPAAGAFSVDPATGRFSGRPPAVTAAQIQGVFEPAVPALLPGLPLGSLRATLDSVKIRASGEPFPDDGIASFDCAGLDNFQGLCTEYFFSFVLNGVKTVTSAPAFQPILNNTFGEPRSATNLSEGKAVPFDPASAARYGLPDGFGGSTALVQYATGVSGESSQGEQFIGRRGQANLAPGGSRWFVGDNETVDHPTVGRRVGDRAPGQITGVDSIYSPLSHIDQNPALAGTQAASQSVCMQVFNYGLGLVSRQADIELVWGANGTVSRVYDLTHNVDIPFSPEPQASWGFVTDNNANGRIDWADITYTEGVLQVQNHLGFCGNGTTGVAGPSLMSPSAQATGVLPEPGNGRPLVQTAVATPVTNSTPATALGNGANFGAANGTGFGLYVAGHYHIFYLTGGALPPAGTRWVLRSTAGFLSATNGGTLTPSNYTYNVRPAVAAVPGLSVDYVVQSATSARAVTNSDLARVHTVPDPYYVTNEYESSTDNKILKFVNLPNQAIIRIYTSSGVLVRILEHNATDLGGAATWDLRNRNNQVVASGVYFYHIESGDARRVGRFTIVNFAQ